MNKYILLLSVAFSSLFACQQGTKNNSGQPEANVFPNEDYNYVIAYHYNGEDGKYIWGDNQVHPMVLNSKKLKDKEVKQLVSILNDKNHYGGDVSRCFRPHLGFIFYNKEDIPTDHISICFECNNHKASSTILASQEAPMNMYGYSPEGRRQLMDFCKQLDFGHCVPSGTTSNNEDDLHLY